jgi:hypothetical protein
MKEFVIFVIIKKVEDEKHFEYVYIKSQIINIRNTKIFFNLLTHQSYEYLGKPLYSPFKHKNKILK